MGLYRRKDSPIWYMSFMFDGKQYQRSTDTEDKKEAQRRLDSVKGKIAEKKWFPETITEAIQKYLFSDLKEKYAQWAAGRQRSWGKSRRYMAGQLDRYFGKYLLSEFNTLLVEQFQTHEINRGLNPGGVNRLVGTLKSMFTKAFEWEMVSEEVNKKVHRAKSIKGEKEARRKRFLTKEECSALIRAASKEIKPIIIFALNTGCRMGEIFKLQWEKHIDLRNGLIIISADISKTGSQREIPMNNTVRSTLQGLIRRVDVPYVFYDPSNGQPYGGIEKSFNSALKKAGIKKGTGVDVVVPHTLRHTFASHLVMAGVDITTVSKLMGHSTLTMTLRYAHLAPAHLVEGVKKLDLALQETSLESGKKESEYYNFMTVTNQAVDGIAKNPVLSSFGA